MHEITLEPPHLRQFFGFNRLNLSMGAPYGDGQSDFQITRF